MKALILFGEGFEDVELLSPHYRLLEEGIEVVSASNDTGGVRGKHGYVHQADTIYSEVDVKDYDLLVLPGGKGPEKVRLDDDALKITKHFMDECKPVAAICHGPQILVSAGCVKGRKLTAWRGIQDDLKAAGAEVADVEVVVDGNLVTSRQPGDLPYFNKKMIESIRGT